MADDATPTPPLVPPSKHDPQGFPPRPMPYGPQPVAYSVIPMDTPKGEPSAAALILDVPSQRLVLFLTRDDMRKMAETMLALTGRGLTVADQADLAALRDPSQIIEP